MPAWLRSVPPPAGLRELRGTDRTTARHDAMAGLVLGTESVPDGLASGILAGVNPIAGLYAYLFGMVGGALFTSASFMAVQATGAMAIIVADVDLASRPDPSRSLFTLSVLTGIVMVVAGVLRLGRALRFVSNPVMTGFISAIGVNIVLGQLANFTGYEAEGAGRVARAVDLVAHVWEVDLATTAVGVLTVALIVGLRRTRLGALGLVVAVVAGSAVAALFDAGGSDVLTLADIADVPRSLPGPVVPAFGEALGLLLPAASLAFVGLVQGAGVSAGVPNRDGRFSDQSQDFVGQGVGNVVAGVFQGMPVGGSMSASSLVVGAGARSRLALLVAGGVMAVVILLLGGLVGAVAMPSLAGLLIVVGVESIKPNRVMTVARTGVVQLVVMASTLVLTIVMPVQYAVLAGVAISVLLVVLRQSTRLVTRQVEFAPDGRMREVDPPATVPPGEVVVLQPYGSIFFASARALEEQLPMVAPTSARSVVILRLRGVDDAGATLIDVLARYASSLRQVGSKFMLVTDNERVLRQLQVTGVLDVIGEENFYRGTEWVGETVRRAHADATSWVQGPPDG